MATLKRYSSFEALKADSKTKVDVEQQKKNHKEFESFVKQLQAAYSQKKEITANDEKPDNR